MALQPSPEDTQAVPIAGTAVVQAEVPAQSVVVVSPVKQPSRPPSTTEQEDLTTAGQRRINLIWEYTQAAIALCVVAVSLIAAVIAMVKGQEVSAFLSFICGNVVGFYFSRTNHAAIGGVGKQPNPPYEGR